MKSIWHWAFGAGNSIKALQFLRANSASFGGNPDNVTVVGQSAGAINVWALQTSPLMTAASPKLFHRVMPLSGGISLATNLPPGCFVLRVTAEKVRLEWRPAKAHSGGSVAREFAKQTEGAR